MFVQADGWTLGTRHCMARPRVTKGGGCDAGGFSHNVIPAKGEAREPGSIPRPVPGFEMDPGCRLLRGSSGVTRGGAAPSAILPRTSSLGEPRRGETRGSSDKHCRSLSWGAGCSSLLCSNLS